MSKVSLLGAECRECEGEVSEQHPNIAFFYSSACLGSGDVLLASLVEQFGQYAKCSRSYL